eukprot:Gb_41725 [translate_table: standard]
MADGEKKAIEPEINLYLISYDHNDAVAEKATPPPACPARRSSYRTICQAALAKATRWANIQPGGRLAFYCCKLEIQLAIRQLFGSAHLPLSGKEIPLSLVECLVECQYLTALEYRPIRRLSPKKECFPFRATAPPAVPCCPQPTPLLNDHRMNCRVDRFDLDAVVASRQYGLDSLYGNYPPWGTILRRLITNATSVGAIPWRRGGPTHRLGKAKAALRIWDSVRTYGGCYHNIKLVSRVMGNLPAQFGEHLIRMSLGVNHHIIARVTVLARFADWLDPEFTFDPVFDSPTMVMPIVVTFVSSLVHPHPISYMSEDPHSPRFMCYSSIPTFSTPMSIIGDNFLQLFLGWEGVGPTPYLSINSWSTRLQADKAATKAMPINRIRSHTRSPNAMEGPTPVSASIHAATTVTTGVSMIARCSPSFEYSPTALIVITSVGAMTSFSAATTEILQNDSKRVIAHPTHSQSGCMIPTRSISNYSISVSHSINHAFPKALLFSSAGPVNHAMLDEQDMRKMGGLASSLPFTYAMMLIGSLSPIGFPFPTGFYSKDVIPELAYTKYTINAPTNPSGRDILRCHDAPIPMAIPSIFLAFGSLSVGYLAKCDLLAHKTGRRKKPGGPPSYKSYDTGAGFSKKPGSRVAKRAHLETQDLSSKCEGESVSSEARHGLPIVTKFVWATGEWAIIFLGSICLGVVEEVPNFKGIPVKMTDPVVGASTTAEPQDHPLRPAARRTMLLAGDACRARPAPLPDIPEELAGGVGLAPALGRSYRTRTYGNYYKSRRRWQAVPPASSYSRNLPQDHPLWSVARRLMLLAGDAYRDRPAPLSDIPEELAGGVGLAPALERSYRT